MSRRDRRSNDPSIIQKREQFASKDGGGSIIAAPTMRPSKSTGGNGGGYGVGNENTRPASGTQPAVNPFMQPKSTGLNLISQSFLPNYYVEWNLQTWRVACDQAIKSGYCTSYGTLTSWAFECSPFIQSLFTKLGSAIDRVKFVVIDKNGEQDDDMTKEFCSKPWQIQLRREILFSCFWGFSGFNFDPYEGKIYKYPLQQIDPINRMLKASTYAFFDGISFADNANLLFVQPSTSYESFLGWMQPITRSFIQMNLTKNNWVAAGRRLAFPLLTVGYPQNDGARDPVSGIEINQFKVQAEDIAANVDPSKGLVYPYTLDGKGDIQKAVEIDFENPGAGANIHKIYSEFNETEKNEIREMIFGGSLTSATGANGNRSVAEVQERMLDAVVESKLEFILSILNYDFIPKIERFYTNLPEGWSFHVNRKKELTMEEIGALSKVVVENGKRFTDDFFEANGIAREFIEDAPEKKAPQAVEDNVEVKMATAPSSFFGSKKKYF